MNPTVKNINGEVITNARVITYFQVDNTIAEYSSLANKTYCFYTLDEVMQDGEDPIKKMYVAATNSNLVAITPEEWQVLKTVMVNINKGNKLSNLKFLPINNNLIINLNTDPSVIAVKQSKLDIFSQNHSSSVDASLDTTNEPVGTYLDQSDLVAPETTVIPVQTESIFATPVAPAIEGNEIQSDYANGYDQMIGANQMLANEAANVVTQVNTDPKDEMLEAAKALDEALKMIEKENETVSENVDPVEKGEEIMSTTEILKKIDELELDIQSKINELREMVKGSTMVDTQEAPQKVLVDANPEELTNTQFIIEQPAEEDTQSEAAVKANEQVNQDISTLSNTAENMPEVGSKVDFGTFNPNFFNDDFQPVVDNAAIPSAVQTVVEPAPVMTAPMTSSAETVFIQPQINNNLVGATIDTSLTGANESYVPENVVPSTPVVNSTQEVNPFIDFTPYEVPAAEVVAPQATTVATPAFTGTPVEPVVAAPNVENIVPFNPVQFSSAVEEATPVVTNYDTQSFNPPMPEENNEYPVTLPSDYGREVEESKLRQLTAA